MKGRRKTRTCTRARNIVGGGGGGGFVLNGRRRKIYLYPMVLWHEERLTIQIARAHT